MGWNFKVEIYRPNFKTKGISNTNTLEKIVSHMKDFNNIWDKDVSEEKD
jgi:hypothetical protein